MKIAAIYDVHGNLPALTAVLDEVRQTKPDLVVFGGDVVPGPMPVECIESLLNIGIPTKFVRGNGDREVLAQFDGDETEWVKKAPDSHIEPVRWCAERLTESHARAMREWQDSVRVDGTIFCHATPRNDTEIFTKLTPEDVLLPVFEDTDATNIVCGHTHMQFDRKVGAKRVINAGSVGMTFGEPGAYWLLLGSDVRLKRTAYDLEKSAALISATEYPQAEQFARNNVIRPPGEEEMLELLGKAALR